MISIGAISALILVWRGGGDMQDVGRKMGMKNIDQWGRGSFISNQRLSIKLPMEWEQGPSWWDRLH